MRIIIGIIIGIVLDRWSTNKVLLEKDKEVEKNRGILFLMGEWLSMYEKKKSVEDALRKKKINNVAIYGMGILGNHLYQALKDSSVKVKYIIDQNEIKGVYNAQICKVGGKIEGVDAVIVTPLYQFEDIKSKIQETNDLDVISLREILHGYGNMEV